MSEYVMAEQFPEVFQVEGNFSFEVQNAVYYCFGERYETEAEQDSAIQHAVINHDALTEHLRLKEEECKQLQQDKAELVELVDTQAERIKTKDQLNDGLAKEVISLTEENKQLKQDKAEFLSAMTEISNMCIGEMTMGYKLDAQYIGALIFKATGLTNPQLNELEKHK